MRALVIGVVAAVLGAAGCGGASPPAARTTRTLVSPGGVRPIAVPRPTYDTPPLPSWRGPVPHVGGAAARGPRGRAWITSRKDADGDIVNTLWFAPPGGGPRRLLDRSGGVMEGGQTPLSPLWVGPALVWAQSTDHDGTDYDSAIVRWNPVTGHRSRVSIPNAYIESLAVSGRLLAVTYVPTDETGDAIGPDSDRERTGVFPLRRLDA